MSGFPRWFRWTLVAVCLIAALFLRVWRLTSIPPGFHMDEAMDTHLAQKILQGQWFFYTNEGWGREGLYYYLAAPVLYVVQDGVLGMRLASVLIGLGMACLAGLLAARLFDADTGALTLAWVGLSFWPTFMSRVAVRNISLGLMLTLALLVFWKAWVAPTSPRRAHLARFGLAGLLMGLSLYTYQPARVSPAILVAFALYTALFHRQALRARWRGMLLCGVVLIITVLPLALFLALNPVAEGPERAAMAAPLSQLLSGHPRAVLDNLVALLKMFTIRGDTLITYNLPGRPVFPGLAGLFFYLGLLVCASRWRNPACALIVFWLGIMLLPSLVTTDAPHFFRSVGAIVPAMLLPALGLASLARLAAQRWSQWGQAASIAITLVLLGQTAWLTYQDYFNNWAQLDHVSRNYTAKELALARYLGNDPLTTTVVGSEAAEAGTPFIVSMALGRELANVRWVIPSQAMVFPAEQPDAQVILTTNGETNDYLARNFFAWPPTVTLTLNEQPWLMTTRLCPPAVAAPLPEVQAPQAGPWLAPAGASMPQSAESLAPARLPVEFQHTLALLQYGMSSHQVQAGGSLRLVTMWQVLARQQSGSLAMFAHLVDSHSTIIAQQDLFGYPLHSWQVGDLVVQIHDLTLDPATPPGMYWLQIGFYQRESPERWGIIDSTGQTAADRLILDQIQVQP